MDDESSDGAVRRCVGPRGLQLGLSLGMCGGAGPSAAPEPAASERMGEGDGCNVEEDESFSGSDRASCDRDVQYKRAKVISRPEKCCYAALNSAGAEASASPGNNEDHTLSECRSGPSENEMVLFHGSILNEAAYGSPMDSSGGGDGDGDNVAITNMEDLFVRMDLTDDLLHMVFSFLDHVDLCRAARVCRQWRAASSHEDFWRRLNFENRNISLVQFADMCRRYQNASEVNILGAPAIDVLVMEATLSLRNIEVLILGKGWLSDAIFQSLADCRALKRLSISEASLGNGGQEITLFHDKLRQLEVTRCRVLRISIRCPLLETLSLKRSNMSHAVLACPQLLELDIAACHKLTDGGIRSVATSCPLLTVLDMSNCSCVSDETLREISLSCGNLRKLNASYCPNVALESVRLPMLKVLKLHNCEGITSASMAAISHSLMLEHLELDCCGLLTSVSLDLPRLQSISFVHCRKFVDLNLRCPALSSITISNCPALHCINITSNSLQKLTLQRQESLTSVLLQCHRLQEVDLTDCDSLTNAVCDVFSNGGGCPMLRSLVLDNCESLTMVEFKCSSLVNLSLAGCRAMTSLELVCPNLQEIHLDGCDHLENASFCPVGLQSLNLGICPKLSVLHIEAPHMSVLELKGCGVLSRASIVCPCLKSLDASFCGQFPDDCLSATTDSCPLIESLVLMSCPSIGHDGLSSLRGLPYLTLLDLSYTFLMSLQPVFESCMHLKVLKLQACKYLASSSLDALYKGRALPALRELDLSYGSICQSSIEELLACCTHLTHVSLNGCINMHDLDWGSGVDRNERNLGEHPERLLQNLNCVGCPNIKKVVIPLMPLCVHLSSLNLSLSLNLREVDLACSNLVFLNLSNCSSLEILKLECPKLSSLFLQSCSIGEEEVEAAISKCNLLETLDIRYCAKINGPGMVRFRSVCPSLKRIFNSLS